MDTTHRPFLDLTGDETAPTPPKPRSAGWPLMSDVATHRAGVPELLIQWRRARGEDDPDPQA